MREVSIYGLCGADDRVRYIGKTRNDLASRLRQHRSDARRKARLPVHRWMRKEGVETIRIVLLETVDESQWVGAERTWIQALGPVDLLNLAKGGEGWPGGGFSAEHRKAISESLKRGRFIPCQMCGGPMWVPPSLEGKRKFCKAACRHESDKGKQWGNSHPRQHNRPPTPQAVAAAAAKRRATTHCPAGHPYAGENLRVSNGRRHCRACARQHAANYRKRIRNALSR